MRRSHRTASLYSSVKHNDKKHCPQDLACYQCCKCVERLTKQNKILSERNLTLGKEKEEYLKEIMRLNKVVKGWEKRQREFKDLEEVKRRLRLEVKAELEDQTRVDDMIVKEKLASLKKEKEILQKQKADLLDNLDLFSTKFEKITQDYRTLEEKHGKLLAEHDKKGKQLQKSEQLVAQLKKRNSQLESSLRDKTDLITKLEKSLSTSQHNYLIEKAKNADTQLNLMKTKAEVKTAALSIGSLQQQTEKKKACIQQLSLQKGALEKTVHNLSQTVINFEVLQGELRNRILATQEYALQKDIQNKKLQSDYYDVLYRRSY